MRILEDFRYGQYKGHEYRLMTSRSIKDIWDNESNFLYSDLDEMYDDVDNLMRESLSVLAKYGYDFDNDYLDFRVDFDNTQIIARKTISYIFDKYVDKDGADLVSFDTGYIGFVFYRTNIINSIEILGTPLIDGGDDILEENLAMNNIDIVDIMTNVKSDKFREYINSYYGDDYIQASVDIASALNSTTPRSAIAEPVKADGDIVIRVMNKEYALNNKDYKIKHGPIRLTPSENRFAILEMLKG